MKIAVTNRALRLIDNLYGLDYYLLQTSNLDLASRLGKTLKRYIYFKNYYFVIKIYIYFKRDHFLHIWLI